MTAQQSSRLLSLVLFAALCALLAHWVLTLSSLRSLSVPREARVAQTDALETGAAVTLFGGGPQSGPRDVQVAGVVADLADGSGAAIVSIDGGPPQAIRAGKALSPSLKLVEIKARSVVIERNGVRQEIALPASAVAGISPAGRNAALPLPPSGAAAPMATPAMPPPPPSAMAGNPANTAVPGAALPLTPAPSNTNDILNAPQLGITGPRHHAAAAARKGSSGSVDDSVDH
ncbi:type II secretion system protein N [Ralstonia syzygii subsp. celebesensis]|uniref:Pilus assembly protein PilZ n=4 Tax=Ralstonia solanacearum species complex TaxID=3116862 RepID=A0AAD0SAT2_RALSL|nr:MULTISPECIES: type II secretion system protein N [Ralstonia solanacearum species complex]CCA80162.1 General Secretory Pathway protein C, type II secretion system [blood disease bacterium R229]AMP36316.1 pilus assembly protein PilZ [Ralstonia solanacearum]AQW29746.1 pilus assembly protein PilZ [blood disease bacterium A2-HR MARDI]AXV75735.1 pilus assembly protein PilZ [Ralstonia solanacearum]AXV83049.1 pilus assembly protein PilZ [Ralstonia solanacearum]